MGFFPPPVPPFYFPPTLQCGGKRPKGKFLKEIKIKTTLTWVLHCNASVAMRNAKRKPGFIFSMNPALLLVFCIFIFFGGGFHRVRVAFFLGATFAWLF